jgi:hypothetical protein
MGGKRDKCYKKTWAPNLRFVVFFKPNTPLAHIVEEVRKHGKDLTEEDHIVRTAWI